MEKAQKGDLIRITGVGPKSYLKNGEIYEVEGEYGGGDVIFTHKDGSRCYAKVGDYVIHRKAGEEDSEQDAVNSPNHYTQGKFETIEIIEEITKGYSDGYVAYCVGNALKYLARAPFKHGEPSEDLAKAGAYIRFASEYLDAKSTHKPNSIEKPTKRY